MPTRTERAALNLDYEDWYPMFDNKPLVDALLDRLKHRCITVRIDGPSLRAPCAGPAILWVRCSDRNCLNRISYCILCQRILKISISEASMFASPPPPRIALPKHWQRCVQSAVVHAISLAHYSIVYARVWAADSINARVRLAAENDQLYEECALLREELRLKDARVAQLPPQRRPHYRPFERMAILELRAARGWSTKQTADTFLVTSATIASWLKRLMNKALMRC